MDKAHEHAGNENWLQPRREPPHWPVIGLQPSDITRSEDDLHFHLAVFAYIVLVLFRQFCLYFPGIAQADSHTYLRNPSSTPHRNNSATFNSRANSAIKC